MPQTRDQFIATCDEVAKLVRVEYGLTQDAMAYAIGLSKKTLVDIEKGRRTLGWTGAVTLCSVFQDSDVISSTFGGTPTDMILALAFDSMVVRRRTVRGSRIWWTPIQQNDRFVIQQNIISQHYRLVGTDGARVASAFSLDDLLPIFNGRPEGA